MDVKETEQLGAVFSYLKELLSLLSTQKFDLDKIKSDFVSFSDFEAIGRGVTLWRPESTHPNEIIKIEYLPLPVPPAIPPQLQNWVKSDSNPAAPVFADDCDEDPQRAELHSQWLDKRDVWEQEYRRIKQVHSYYEKILSLHTALLQSGYQKELVLGTMIFESAPVDDEKIKYPLLTRRLTIENRVNEKTRNAVLAVCLDEESDTEVDPVPVIQCDELDCTPLKTLKDHLRFLDLNPLATEDNELEETFSQLPAQLAPTCRWLKQPPSEVTFDDSTRFVVYKRPIFLIRNKDTGLKETLDTVLNQLREGSADIPPSLTNIVCGLKHQDKKPISEPTPEARIAETAGEDEDILMVKPANPAQLLIAREIQHNPAVVVQGPPGTGKTHTIANLLAHFLAQGKRVLVTSASPNALTVLKNKLPQNLQPLCVSMTGSGKEMETSITSLVDNLTAKNSAELKRRVTQLEQDRKTTMGTLRELRQKLFKARKLEKEGRTVTVETFKGHAYSLDELAQELYRDQALENIIPGDVLTDDLPLSKAELDELYSTNGKWSPDDAVYFGETNQVPRNLPTAQDFRMQVERIHELENTLNSSLIESKRSFKEHLFRRIFWDKNSKQKLLDCPTDSLDALPQLLSSQQLNFLSELVKDNRLLCVLEAGRTDGAEHARLSIFIEDLEKLCDLHETILQNIRFTVQIPQGMDLSQLEEAVIWLKERCTNGKINLGRLSRFFNNSKFEIYNCVKVTGINNETSEALAAVERQIALEKQIHQFRIEAQQLQTCLSLDTEKLIRDNSYAKNFALQLTQAFHYWEETCCPLLQAFKMRGITLALKAQPSASDVVRCLNECCRPVSEFLTHELELDKLQQSIKTLQKQIETCAPQSTILQQLCTSVKTLDANLYAQTLKARQQKDLDYHHFETRRQFLTTLRKCAPQWAAEIANSTVQTPPSHVFEAWDWKLKNKRFAALHELDVKTLNQETSQLSQHLRKLTCELVENKAWLLVKERMDDSNELATLRYVATQFKKIGKGTGKGKGVMSAKKQIRDSLPQCQLAVPIWIMPMTSALANFKSENKFDVLIVDEASQADITTLPVLLTAKKAIIVGDDQQVSPISFANESQIESLINSHLTGSVSRVNLYKPDVSLYDVCSSTYHVVMLQEHFRCVPPIIEFSNQLSYEGKINPLRDSSSSNLLPAMIPWQVDGTRKNDGTNHAEAETIVGLIKACLRQEEYADKTFGIIPMLSSTGSNQVKLINQLITSQIPADQVKKHDIRCGLSKDFQGDERDVIFLSLVDSLEEGKTILRTQSVGRGDLMKKRYNVAVSRAKDQLWVVHSFDWSKEVTVNDLRYRLLSHINAVNSQKKSDIQIDEQSESPFESSVAKALNDRGYAFIQQYPVGPYRLDFVVTCGTLKVALECDGDEFHSTEDQVLHDMQRQCVLERNGWKFIRLSGSEYYRNPIKALDRVCADLEAMGIRPEVALLETSDLLQRIKASLPAGGESPLTAEDFSNLPDDGADDAADQIDVSDDAENIPEEPFTSDNAAAWDSPEEEESDLSEDDEIETTESADAELAAAKRVQVEQKAVLKT